MSFVLRSLVAGFLLLGLVRCGVAQEYSVGAGEIRFDGALVSFDDTKKIIVLNVETFTLPSGKSSHLPAPKPKNILLSPQTKLAATGKFGDQVLPLLQPGAVLVVIGKDAGSGKDLPARTIFVGEPAAASTPAASVAVTPPSDPNDIALQAGEMRYDARVTGILSATNITVSVFGVSNAAGESTELFPAQTKTLVLEPATPLRSRGDATRKLKFEDLKIGSRITFATKDDDIKVRAREIAIWETENSSSESIGVVTVSGPVSALLGQAEQAENARAYEESVRLLNRALQAADGMDDRAGRALTLSRLGSVYGDMNQPQKAFAAFEGALATWRAMNNSQNQATTLNNYGILLGKHGQQEKAVEILERAVQLGRGGNPRGMALTLQNLAEAYSNAGKNDKSLDAALEALPFVRQTKKIADDEAVLLAEIARLYAIQKNAAKATEYAALSEALLDQMREKRTQAYTTRVLGVTYQANGQVPRAIEFYKRSQALYTGLEENEIVTRIGEEIAKLQKPAAG